MRSSWQNCLRVCVNVSALGCADTYNEGDVLPWPLNKIRLGFSFTRVTSAEGDGPIHQEGLAALPDGKEGPGMQSIVQGRRPCVEGLHMRISLQAGGSAVGSDRGTATGRAAPSQDN